jgi:hypothetical protein
MFSGALIDLGGKLMCDARKSQKLEIFEVVPRLRYIFKSLGHIIRVFGVPDF